jgi:iduronate 2-sulfatase
MFPLEEIELSLIKPDDSEDTYYKDIYPPDRKGPRYYRTLRESYNGDAELGLKHFLQAYLACVAFVDEQIGVVVEALNNSKFKDNTIIIMTSDHGWQMGEKDYLFKNSPWEESTRIPLIIKAPGVQSGQLVDHPVSLIDIFPTLTAICHLKGNNIKNPQGAAIDGFSLWPFLKDPETTDWDGPEGALTMLGVGMNQEEVMRQTYTYRTRDWRYIRYLNGQEELYDLLNDPYEWENLADIKKFEKIKMRLNREMMDIINSNQ